MNDAFATATSTDTDTDTDTDTTTDMVVVSATVAASTTTATITATTSLRVSSKIIPKKCLYYLSSYGRTLAWLLIKYDSIEFKPYDIVHAIEYFFNLASLVRILLFHQNTFPGRNKV